MKVIMKLTQSIYLFKFHRNEYLSQLNIIESREKKLHLLK